MEQTKNATAGKTKILIIISTIIIIVGLILIFTKGLNFDFKYREGQKVDIRIGEDFEKSDIKNITNEVFEGQKVLIQEVEIYKDTVSIRTSSISDEQKEKLVNKINEKYGLEIKTEDIEIKNIANLRGRNIIKPYLIPMVITTGAIIVYMAIRFYKLNILKVSIKTILCLAIAELILLSLIAIFRIPVSNYTIIAGFAVYIFTLLYETDKLEKELEKKKAEDEKQ